MLYDLSAVVPLLIVVATIAVLGGLVSVAVIAQTLVRHHRVRVTRHQSIPTYYRHVLLVH